MPQQSHHPSREDLNAYSLGQLPEDQAVVIDDHISKCEPCCETIVGLSSDDTFAELLKEARSTNTDQTALHDGDMTGSAAMGHEIPAPLIEHSRYEILGLIGKGGMGDVYEAKHRMMERTVALKIINREFVRRPEAVDRFHREVKTAAQLSHPNIVTAHDAEQAGDVHFLAMEYVDGIDLSHVIKNRGALPLAEACDFVRQAATGLQYAHERGMVHRDIKPHNLMVTGDGTVKILDFGLASLATEQSNDSEEPTDRSQLTAVGAIMGTPDFISPEQAENARHADTRSDIYSLGATFYFLLSGRVPFSEGSVMHKLRSHAQREPESLQSVRRDVPDELAAIVSKMMAKDPSDRFQNPAEVAEALQSLGPLRETSTTKRPQAKVASQTTRWPALAASMTLLLMVIAAGVVYYVQTNQGIVRIEVADESLEVSIRGQTITTRDGEDKSLQIQAGQQNLVVSHPSSGFQFETDNFEIRRHGEISFKVQLLDGSVTITKDGKPFGRENLPDPDGDSTDPVIPSKLRTDVPAYADQHRIQGTWQVTSQVVDGVTTKRDWEKNVLYFMVLEHTVDYVGGEKIDHAKYRLDPTKRPKTIDIRHEDGIVSHGIYELEGDSLRYCFPSKGVTIRPTSFDSSADSKTVLTTLKLIERPYQLDEIRIQETWQVTSRVVSGVASDPTELKSKPSYFTFDTGYQIDDQDREIHVGQLVMRQGMEKTERSYRIVRTDSNLKSINFVDDDGEITRGIYEFQDDKLRLCLQDPKSNERPLSFDSTPKTQTTLMTLEVVPPSITDHQRIQGTWQLSSLVEDGVVVADTVLQSKPVTYVFDGSKLLRNDGSEKLDTDFYLDRPLRVIVLINEDWQTSGGRYEFDGDTLKIRFSLPVKSADNPNPDAKPTRKVQLLIFKRVSKSVTGDQPAQSNAEVDLPRAG